MDGNIVGLAAVVLFMGIPMAAISPRFIGCAGCGRMGRLAALGAVADESFRWKRS